MRILKRLLFLLYLLPLTAFADSIPFQDQSQIRLSQFDTTRLNEYRNDEAYVYKLEDEPDLSWFEKLLTWLREFLADNDIDIEPSNLEDYIKVGIWILIIALTGFIIWFLLKSNGVNIFRRRSNIDEAEVSFLNFDGSKEDLELLWKDAEQDKDYPLALKYLFISSLNLLHRAGLLTWRSDKTNREYLNDLEGKNQYPYEQKLTSIFERVHYGDYEFSAEQYKLTKEIYKALQESMKGGKA